MTPNTVFCASNYESTVKFLFFRTFARLRTVFLSLGQVVERSEKKNLGRKINARKLEARRTEIQKLLEVKSFTVYST